MRFRNDRVLFVPWDRADAGTFATEHTEEQRLGSHHEREWTSVCMDDPGEPLKDVGLGFGTRIHVVGHGAIGDPEIDPDHGVGAAPVGVDDLVQKMFQKGLRKYYVGTIACDVCYSALGDPSFAKMLARALWKAGVKASCVLGYKGPLYSTYRDRNAGSTETSKLTGGTHKYRHRVVGIEDQHGNEIGYAKSKNMQERFFGWT